MTEVKSGDIISLAAKNWVAVPGKQTFLYATRDLNWFGTDNNVTITDPGNNIDSRYLFKITICGGSGSVKYGDRVNIESLTNKFIQCGSGTCNSGNNPSCVANDWQVFTVVSATGKTGNVNIGETLTLTQETGGKCSILPADNSKILCGTTINSNEYLQFFLPNGTDGRTAEEAQQAYNDNRSNLLRTQNSSQAGLEDTGKVINSVGDGITGLFEISLETKIGLALCCCCILLCSVMLVLLKLML